MIRVYADFNDGTADGGYWILQYAECDLADKAVELGLAAGDRILLYQDDDDFEVEAALAFRRLDETGNDSWVAYPDWGSLKRLSPQPASMNRAAE